MIINKVLTVLDEYLKDIDKTLQKMDVEKKNLLDFKQCINTLHPVTISILNVCHINLEYQDDGDYKKIFEKLCKIDKNVRDELFRTKLEEIIND